MAFSSCTYNTQLLLSLNWPYVLGGRKKKDCGWLSNSPPPPKRSTSLFLESVTAALYGKRDLAHVTKLKILRCWSSLGSPEWFYCDHEVFIIEVGDAHLRREAGGECKWYIGGHRSRNRLLEAGHRFDSSVLEPRGRRWPYRSNAEQESMIPVCMELICCDSRKEIT